MNFNLVLEIINSIKVLRVLYYVFLLAITIFFLSGCSTTRDLKEKEYLLDKQVIKGRTKVSKDDLTLLLKQKPNRKIFGTKPYLYFYWVGRRFYDTLEVRNEILQTTAKYDSLIIKNQEKKSKIDKLTKTKESKLGKLQTKLKEGNWFMRVPGEPPVLYDTALAQNTLQQMNYYLRSKGYFTGTVETKVDTFFRNIKVTYLVKEGEPYKLRKIELNIDDPEIKKLIYKHQGATLLKKGDKYDEAKISEERERLNQIMKNNGYYDFNRQFIYFEVDSGAGKRQVDIHIILADPPKEKHQKYTIGKIYFNTDISEFKNNVRQDTSFYRDIYFIYNNSYFSKKILSYKLKFKPGDFYNQTQVQQSQRQLGSMDMYKFVNINFEKDTSNTLIAYIHTSPLKKFQITQEYGVNVGNAWLPGPFLNVSFKNRNFLSGFEVFETSIRYSIDAQPSITNDDKSLTNQEFGLNFSLTFPQLYFPTKLRYKFINYNPKTKLQLGYTLTDRPDYIRKNLRAALTYNFSTSQYSQFLISPIDVNIINSDISSPFKVVLDSLETRGSNLIRSFNPSIVTNFNATYIFNNNEIGKVKTSKFFKASFEIGGNVVRLLDETFEGVNTENKYFGKQYFQYYKINTDLRYYFPVSRKSVLAIRFNAGFAKPYGNDSNLVLPYEKYFFAGGGNSIRGWRQRRLGPGTYKDPLRPYLYEQPGEIIFENNYEYRFNISGFFDGAVFVDAGNVWHNHDKSKPGTEFKYFNSIPDLALGTGVGLRLNFSFLILRFDFGYKLRDPAEPKGNRWVSNYNIRDTEINIGIGYPF